MNGRSGFREFLLGLAFGGLLLLPLQAVFFLALVFVVHEVPLLWWEVGGSSGVAAARGLVCRYLTEAVASAQK